MSFMSLGIQLRNCHNLRLIVLATTLLLGCLLFWMYRDVRYIIFQL